MSMPKLISTFRILICQNSLILASNFTRKGWGCDS